eukprot:4791951-Amphidinium_carterae.2
MPDNKASQEQFLTPPNFLSEIVVELLRTSLTPAWPVGGEVSRGDFGSEWRRELNEKTTAINMGEPSLKSTARKPPRARQLPPKQKEAFV